MLNKRNWSPAIQNKGKPMATFFKDSTEELQMQIRVFFTEASGFLPLIKNGLVNKHNVESNQIKSHKVISKLLLNAICFSFGMKFLKC